MSMESNWSISAGVFVFVRNLVTNGSAYWAEEAMLPNGSISNQVKPKSPRLAGKRIHIKASFRLYAAMTWRKRLRCYYGSDFPSSVVNFCIKKPDGRGAFSIAGTNGEVCSLANALSVGS